MPRFLLIDPAIKGLTGHHYHFATHVLEEARGRGFEPMLATNVGFQAPPGPLRVIHAFRYANYLNRDDFWVFRQAFAGLGWLGQWHARLRLAWLFSPLGRGDLPPAPGVRAEPAAFNPFASPVGRRAIAWMANTKMAQFARDLGRLFREAPLGAGDVVLIPSASPIEVAGLARFLRGRRPGPSWHLQFHLPPYEGRDPTHEAQETQVAPVRRAFEELVRDGAGHTIRFFTDTEELTRQFERFGVGPFVTLPIPHTRPPAEVVCDGPLRIAYRGDARSEKGFQHLPRLVADLWEDARVRFVFQANASLLRHDPPVEIARGELEWRPADRVELIRRALTPSEYEETLSRGDINLMPYNADTYFARSSGVLTEALAAGIPAIVPAGTWMGRQWAAECQQHIARVLERSPSLGQATGTEAEVPAGTRAVVVTLAGSPSRPGWYFKLRLDMLGPHGNRIARRHAVTELVDRTGRMLLPMEPCTRVRIDVKPLDAGTVDSARMQFLGGSPPPRSAVGIAYGDREDLADVVREIIEHYAHYRESALQQSRAFLDEHNARRYVDMILGVG